MSHAFLSSTASCARRVTWSALRTVQVARAYWCLHADCPRCPGLNVKRLGTGSGADEVGDIVAVVVVALVVIVAVVVIAAIKVKKRRAAWLAAAAGGAGTGMGMSGRDYTGFSNPSYSDRDYAGDDLDSADDGSPSRPTSADALYGHGPDFVNEGAEGSAGITGYLEIDPAPHAE